MAALFLPALIIATGFLMPTGDEAAAAERYDQAYAILGNWFVRIVLIVVVGLCFFHAAHRIRHTLIDLGMRRLGPILSAACYGGAILGAAFTLWIVATM